MQKKMCCLQERERADRGTDFDLQVLVDMPRKVKCRSGNEWAVIVDTSSEILPLILIDGLFAFLKVLKPNVRCHTRDMRKPRGCGVRGVVDNGDREDAFAVIIEVIELEVGGVAVGNEVFIERHDQ